MNVREPVNLYEMIGDLLNILPVARIYKVKVREHKIRQRRSYRNHGYVCFFRKSADNAFLHVRIRSC